MCERTLLGIRYFFAAGVGKYAKGIINSVGNARLFGVSTRQYDTDNVPLVLTPVSGVALYVLTCPDAMETSNRATIAARMTTPSIMARSWKDGEV